MKRLDLKALLLLAELNLKLGVLVLVCGVSLFGWWVIAGRWDKPPEEKAFCGNAIVDYPANAIDSARWHKMSSTYGLALDLRRGEKIWKANCSACHKLDVDMSGPGVLTVFDHAPAPARDWVLAFLLGEDSLVQAGDAYTIELRRVWKTAPEWNHRLVGLSREDAQQVMAWMELQ